MKRHKAEDIRALRGSAQALHHSSTALTERLESVWDQIHFMLDASSENNAEEYWSQIDKDIDVLLDKLKDTQTILRLLQREKELERKLLSLQEQLELESETPLDAHANESSTALDRIKYGDLISVDSEGNILPVETEENIKKIIQRQSLESMVDSVFSKESERLKNLIKLTQNDKQAFSNDMKVPVEQHESRPYRKLDSQIPSLKGQGYDFPDRDTCDVDEC